MDLDFRLDGDSHLNPTFLYSAQDDLLGPSLLTPDSEPTKFDLSTTQKVDTFDYNIGIYDPYDDSRPSSVQFGDGLDPSEHEDSHVSTDGNGIAAASISNHVPEGTDEGHDATANGEFHPASSAKLSSGPKGLKKTHQQALQGTTSPAPASTKNTPKKHASGQGFKRSVRTSFYRIIHSLMNHLTENPMVLMILMSPKPTVVYRLTHLKRLATIFVQGHQYPCISLGWSLHVKE